MSPTAVDDIDPDAPEEVLPFTYAITAYGADYPVDSLVKRIEQGDIFVPDFQRSFVWKRLQADRFVESLLLGLPVPGIFLAVEDASRRLLVVDGQQRLETLRRFYRGLWDAGTVFELKSTQAKFRGLTYDRLDDDDRRRLDDSILHATVIRQDEPSDDQSSIYFVFERLNTGGTTLQPQEIRNSIYRGPFRDLLDKLNGNPSWRAIYGPTSTRLKDRELILRFLALRYSRKKYSQPMKGFLNAFMGARRKLAGKDEATFSQAFEPTVEVAERAFGERAFRVRNALNAAIFDSVMIGLSVRLDAGPISDLTAAAFAYSELLESPEFTTAVTRSTANEENVASRIRLATSAFANVP